MYAQCIPESGCEQNRDNHCHGLIVLERKHNAQVVKEITKGLHAALGYPRPPSPFEESEASCGLAYHTQDKRKTKRNETSWGCVQKGHECVSQGYPAPHPPQKCIQMTKKWPTFEEAEASPELTICF